jgi:hypothetical protein
MLPRSCGRFDVGAVRADAFADARVQIGGRAGRVGSHHTRSLRPPAAAGAWRAALRTLAKFGKSTARNASRGLHLAKTMFEIVAVD